MTTRNLYYKGLSLLKAELGYKMVRKGDVMWINGQRYTAVLVDMDLEKRVKKIHLI